jgi:hypothetical protein
VAAFIAVRKAVRDASLRVKVTKSRYGPRHGRSTTRGDGDVRACGRGTAVTALVGRRESVSRGS